MTVQVRQKARYSGEDWWEWSVWLEGTKKELETIDHVVYMLHATFPDPVRVVKKRSTGFRLDSAGWGEFEIYIEIHRVGGKVQKREHHLTLEYPRESPPAKKAKTKTRAEPRHARSRPPPKDKPRPQLRSTARTKVPPAKPTVYVSSGAADSELARELKERLSGHGVTVSDPDDLTMKLPWEQCAKQAIDKSDAAVFLISGRPNLWSNTEMSYALAKSTKKIIPVLIGTAAKLPATLEGHEALHADSAKDLDAVTNQIMEATKAV